MDQSFWRRTFRSTVTVGTIVIVIVWHGNKYDERELYFPITEYSD